MDPANDREASGGSPGETRISPRRVGAWRSTTAASGVVRNGAALAVAVFVVLAIGVGVVRGAVRSSESDRAFEIHGVSLGMTEGDVRERFRPSGPGHWRRMLVGDPVLEWLSDGAAPTDRAHFEFHGGILVAVRLNVPASDPDAQGPGIDVSSASVLARQGGADPRVELTLLARDCPTHADEVHRLLTRR